ncbi:hypothetical protein L1887_00065 [Cichorium endivia]|nr:hypothetical protein L1887_00065 [Cichorium endivia]
MLHMQKDSNFHSVKKISNPESSLSDCRSLVKHLMDTSKLRPNQGGSVGVDTSNLRPNQGGSVGGDSSMESDWRVQLSAVSPDLLK